MHTGSSLLSILSSLNYQSLKRHCNQQQNSNEKIKKHIIRSQFKTASTDATCSDLCANIRVLCRDFFIIFTASLFFRFGRPILIEITVKAYIWMAFAVCVYGPIEKLFHLILLGAGDLVSVLSVSNTERRIQWKWNL